MYQRCTGIVIFLCLFFLSTLTALEPWKVTVTKNRNTLTFGDTLSVTIDINYPSSYEPNLFEFLTQQEALSEQGYFQLLSSSYEKKNSHITIYLQLAPSKVGTLLFTPGIFTFSAKDESLPLYSLLIPPFSIESKSRFAAPQMAPPLPFNPETAIDLNPENYKVSFENRELLVKEQQHSVARSIAKSQGWTWLVIIFFIASLAVVTFWILKEYDLFAKRPAVIKKRSLEQEFKELKVPQDVSKLSELLRAALSKKEQKEFQGMTSQEIIDFLQTKSSFKNDEKELLQDLLLQLDALQFSNEAEKTNEHWNSLLNKSSFLFK